MPNKMQRTRPMTLQLTIEIQGRWVADLER